MFHRLRKPTWSHQMRQAVREEKWLAECERDALKRDLDHATRRCEQMQQETPQLDAGVYGNNAVVAVDGECDKREEMRSASRCYCYIL